VQIASAVATTLAFSNNLAVVTDDVEIVALATKFDRVRLIVSPLTVGISRINRFPDLHPGKGTRSMRNKNFPPTTTHARGGDDSVGVSTLGSRRVYG
jgi:hypothetical protein